MTPLVSSLTREVEALRQENRLLRERVDLLVRKVFGASSEKLDSMVQLNNKVNKV